MASISISRGNARNKAFEKLTHISSKSHKKGWGTWKRHWNRFTDEDRDYSERDRS
jgi:hypothetical protein